MHRLALAFVSAAAFVVLCSAQQNRGYYRFPSIHGDSMVFTSEGDLWEVGVEGGVARRLTTHLGEETNAADSTGGYPFARKQALSLLGTRSRTTPSGHLR